MKVECQHCGYIEHVNAHIGPKLWAFSIAFGLLLLGKAYFFDSWGVFLQVYSWKDFYHHFKDTIMRLTEMVSVLYWEVNTYSGKTIISDSV